MFGPNTYIKDKSSIQFSHRDTKFINLFKSVKNKFSQNLDWKIMIFYLFLVVSTIGMESIFFSLKCQLMS